MLNSLVNTYFDFLWQGIEAAEDLELQICASLHLTLKIVVVFEFHFLGNALGFIILVGTLNNVST